MSKSALVIGASGIIGSILAEHLVAKGWAVEGLARRPVALRGVTPLAVDLLDPPALHACLENSQASHVFYTSWSRQATEAENCRVNGAMIRHLCDALADVPTLRHFALVTGLKHYLGPFEAYGTQAPATPFREEQPRLPIANFYYTQEDELLAFAARRGISWSVHRPHTVIGHALGNAMNMGVTLAAYATICRETGQPFVFPGTLAQWHALTDFSDGALIAEQLEWAATNPAAANQAYNVVNGDVVRWSWLWGQVAAFFGLPEAPFTGQPQPLAQQMANAAPVWASLAARHGLIEADIARVASWWHTDANLHLGIDCIADVSKSRKAGFNQYRCTPDALFDLFRALRAARIIPG
ncbi:MAG: SDR family oxidoreductase [Janthinobacterium lividum]